MRITHVISSIDRSRGGPSRSVTHLLSSLGKGSPNVQIALYAAKSQKPIIRNFKEPNIDLSFYNATKLGRLMGLEKE